VLHVVDSFVSDGDVRELLGVVERAAPADSDEIFYSNVLTGLYELIPCWDITFQLMDLQRQRVWCTYLQGGVVMQDGPEDVQTDEDRVFMEAFWAEGGCAHPEPKVDYTTIRVESGRELADGDAVGRSIYDAGIRHEVLVPMVPHGLIDRRLLLYRRTDEPAFTERELLMLRMIRPHLAELQQRRHRELIGQPELTARQWEILRRVSIGASNHEVARALGVSDATVRKHLENIFLRLKVVSRTEAVSRVIPFLAIA
jgi:DNA-binding CsgD family transcriptional regulator